MATYQPPKKNTAWIGYISLVSQANTKLLQANPTIAAGDFKVSIDGGAFANLATLPAVTPAAGAAVKMSLSAAEMNGDNIFITCIDAAGAEWCDMAFNLPTAARQVDDLAYPATTGRSIVVDAAGLVDANTVKLGPTGTGTAQTAKDVGGAVPAVAAGASGGILISGANAGTTTLGALTVTGATTHTGNMVLSDGLTISAPSTLNRAGVSITGNGTGAGVTSTGGATGDGIQALGGAAGHGLVATGTGTTKHGITATGGATTSHGINAVGGGVGHGVLATSGAGATGNGIQATAASTNGSGMTLAKTGTGSDLNATVTPLILAKTTNITGLNDIAATAVVSSGAITTSGGAVSTVTTVTNQLTAAQIATGTWQDATAGDFTAALSVGKSVMNGVALGTGLTIASVSGSVGSVTGAVGSVTGAVGSVTGAVGSVTGAVGSVTGNVGGNVTGSVGSVVGLTASNLDTTVSSRATPAQILATALTEAYAADGVAPTLSQILFLINSALTEFSIAGTTITAKKLDGITTAATFTLDDSTNPTSRTRAT